MQNLKFKIILTLALFFLFATPAFASTCGVLPGGGNWDAAGTWFNCAGGIPVTGDDVVATSTSGNLAMNANSLVIKSIDFTGYTGTFSGASQLIVKGLAASTEVIKFSSGMTVTWTGAFNIQPAASSAIIEITTAGKLVNTVTIAAGSAGTIKLMDNMTFSAIKTNALTWSLNGTFDMNGFTISGNSATNRVYINSNAGGQRTITPNGGTFAYADFFDINLNVSTDLSAITGGSGDAGSNSNITFTTATTTYWIGNSGNTDDTAEWSWGSGLAGSTSRVPLPQDICVFDANSFSGTGFTVTNTQQRICAGMDFSAVGTDNPAFSFANTGGFILSTYGSLIMDSGMTISNISGSSIIFAGDDSGKTIDMQGVSIPRPVSFVGKTGDWTLVNDFTTTSTLAVNAGTFDADIYDVTCTVFSMGNTITAIINMGSGTWNVTSTGTVWNIGGANSVVNAETSTIVVSNTLSTSKTFSGAGKNYNNLTITGDDVTITGNNIFNVLALNNPTEAEGLIIGTGSTQTIASITTTASAGNVVLLSGVASGGAETLSDSTGTNCIDYTIITNVTASGGASFYAPYASADGGGNSGWTFSACPVAVPSTPPTHKTLLQRFKMIIFGKMIIR